MNTVPGGNLHSPVSAKSICQVPGSPIQRHWLGIEGCISCWLAAIKRVVQDGVLRRRFQLDAHESWIFAAVSRKGRRGERGWVNVEESLRRDSLLSDIGAGIGHGKVRTAR